MTGRGHVTVQPGNCGRVGRAGRYAADLGEQWNCPIVPQGGIVAATAARAMEAALGDPAQTLRSLNAVFAGPVRARPGRDRGRGAAARAGRCRRCARRCATRARPQASTRSRVFGAEREGFTFTDRRVPDGVHARARVPVVSRSADPTDFDDGPAVVQLLGARRRPADARSRAVGRLRTRRRRSAAPWYRFDDPPRADDGTWDPLRRWSRSATRCRARWASGSGAERRGAGGCRRAPTSPCTCWARRACDWVLAREPGPPRRRRLCVGRHGDLGPRRRRHPAGRVRHPDDGVQLPEIGSSSRSRNRYSGVREFRATLATQSDGVFTCARGRG